MPETTDASAPNQQLSDLRARLAEQGAQPTDADLGQALLSIGDLRESVADCSPQDQQALGVLMMRLAENPALLSAFSQVQTSIEAVALAEAQGITISAEIFDALHAAPQELDDSALAQVTGGMVGTITVGLGIVAAVVTGMAYANKAEAFLYSDSSSFLGDGIRNFGKTVLGNVP